MIHDIWKQNHAIVEGRVGWIDRHFKSATPSASIQKENNKKKRERKRMRKSIFLCHCKRKQNHNERAERLVQMAEPNERFLSWSLLSQLFFSRFLFNFLFLERQFRMFFPLNTRLQMFDLFLLKQLNLWSKLYTAIIRRLSNVGQLESGVKL